MQKKQVDKEVNDPQAGMTASYCNRELACLARLGEASVGELIWQKKSQKSMQKH